jgi:hypothetical protein
MCSQDRSTYFPASRIGIVSNVGIVSLQCRKKHYFPLLTVFYTHELEIDVFHVMAPQPYSCTLLFNIGNAN